MITTIMLQHLSFDFFLEIKVGIPAYFPATSFAGLLELRGDVGARELLREAPAISDESLALDVDTEADVENARMKQKARRDQGSV